MDVKPARKKGQKSPNFFKRLILRVVVDGPKLKTEKDSGAKSRVSGPVPNKETLEKDLVQSAIALRPETLPNANKAESLPPPPPPSLITPSTPTSSPRSVTSTISCSSTSTACEKAEDSLDNEDYSDMMLETDDDKAKISFLRKQNGDLSCKLDSALSEIVQLKIKLNRLLTTRTSHPEVPRSSTADITVRTEPSTPKSVRFADPLEEYEPAALRDVPEAVEALCLAHAQISDLEAEKKATDEEMETLFVELHIVEKQLHKWEEGVTARLKALEDELNDQKNEITYLHNKLREAHGQSPLLAQDALGRSHPQSKRDIPASTNRKNRDVNVQDSDSDWDDTSSFDSNETIQLSKMSPYGWPPLFDEQFPTPLPLTGCLEKAKNILQATLGQKYVPITNYADDLPAASREPEISWTQPNPISPRTEPDISNTNNKVAQDDHSKGRAVGLSLQLPLAIEVGPFDLPDASKPRICATAAASTVHFDPRDMEAGSEPIPQPTKVDIEHVAVTDDPRQWSSHRKAINLTIISITAIAPALGVNIYNPAFNQIKQQLHATNQEVALSLSIFIFVQGTSPLLWSAITLAIYAVGCIAAALARSMAVLISMRTIQAFGASVAFTLGSGTIADMYDTHERGARVGLFYAVPLLGPSIGPMLGGIVVQVWNWRATFWLMVILAGFSMAMFLFFKETFRKERSLAYQSAQKRAVSRSQSRLQSAQLSRVPSRDEKTPRTVITGDHHVSRLQDLEKGTPVSQEEAKQVKPTFADINPVGPAWKILKQKSNIVVLLASGSFFGFSYGICYTCARTFAAPPYSYNALKVGSVLLSFGLGNVAGSILGGKWSDRILSRLKAANGGVSKPE
ncbi:hypothetical protein FS837_012777, partial [Tulasnella sp. UAMH 9824]